MGKGEIISASYTIIFDGENANGGDGGSLPNASDPQIDGEPNPNNAVAPKNNKNSASKFIGMTALASSAKNIGSYAIGNIGKFSGSQYMQEQANNVMKAVGYAGLIAINPIAGTVALATDLALQAFDYGYSRRWEKREFEQVLQKLGENVNR